MSQIQESLAEKPRGSSYTAEERTWAAIAHASSILTLLVALGSAGIGGLIFAFIPLGIYLIYKDRSEYVAYHAAQAFALQMVGSVGYFLAILAAIIIWVVAVVIVALLSVILIGLVLVPILIIATLVLVLALVAFPFVLGGFSLVATIQTGSGEDYRYPYLGRWVENWLAQSQPSE
jgi:uncharacterized Tic20 family protein